MRRVLCMVLVLLICSFSILSFVYADNEENTMATDLKTEQEQLQQQINEANNELEEVQDELSENLRQVQNLDERISSSQEELDKLNIKIAELQNSIEEIEYELNIAEENYNKQNELLGQRLVAIYESGDTQYLDVILSSRNISEFLSNYFLITELARYDTELLEELKEKKDKIELSKKKLDNDKEQLGIIKVNQTKTSRVLENTKVVRESYITKLSDQEKEIQSKIDEYNTRFNEINAEILAMAMEGLDTKYIGGELAWPVPRVYKN